MLDLAKDALERAYTRTTTVHAAIFVLLALIAATHLLGAFGMPAAVAQTDPATSPTVAETPAKGGYSTDYSGAVIPPGQEDLLAEMLGRGATLPGQCEFDGGQADGPTLHATYKCATGEVVFELRHPGKAPANAIETKQFAITLQSGQPPDGLADALATLIRSHEATFEWKWVGPKPKPFSPVVVVLTAAGLIACVVLGWVLYRRPRAATNS